MKISELLEAMPSKVSKVMPGQSAEIDHGDGTKTVVDLKKNPNALSKDTTGKLKLNKKPQQGQKNSDEPKAGDIVQVDNEDK